MRPLFGALCLACLCSLSAASMAQTSEQAADWGGNVRLGAVLISGNADVQRFNGELNLERRQAPWRNALTASGLYARDRSVGQRSALRYSLFLQNDYSLTDRDYLFNKNRYEYEEFSGLDYNAQVSVGVGRHLIRMIQHRLKAEIGVGHWQFRRTATGEVTNDTFALISADYRWSVAPNIAFNQTVTGEVSDQRRVARFVSRLGIAMTAQLDFSVAHDVRYSSPVIGDREPVDTVTTMNLGYRF